MADVDVGISGSLPDHLTFKYKDMGDGTYALVGYAGAASGEGSARMEAYNETTWDSYRNNTNVDILASAVRATSTTSATQTNYNSRGAYILFDITVVPGTDTVQLFVDILQPDGTFTAIMQGAAISAAALYKYLLFPEAVDDDSQLTEVTRVPIPRTWHIRIIHSAASDFTYAVSAYYVR